MKHSDRIKAVFDSVADTLDQRGRADLADMVGVMLSRVVGADEALDALPPEDDMALPPPPPEGDVGELPPPPPPPPPADDELPPPPPPPSEQPTGTEVHRKLSEFSSSLDDLAGKVESAGTASVDVMNQALQECKLAWQKVSTDMGPLGLSAEQQRQVANVEEQLEKAIKQVANLKQALYFDLVTSLQQLAQDLGESA